jgi:hypothetical protein
MHSLPAHEFTVVQQASQWTTLVKGSYENCIFRGIARRSVIHGRMGDHRFRRERCN